MNFLIAFPWRVGDGPISDRDVVRVFSRGCLLLYCAENLLYKKKGSNSFVSYKPWILYNISPP